MKFATPNGVGLCGSNQKESRSLYLKALKGGAVCTVETLEVDGRKEGAEPAEEMTEVQIGAEANNTTRIGAMLPATLREKLIAFLR